VKRGSAEGKRYGFQGDPFEGVVAQRNGRDEKIDPLRKKKTLRKKRLRRIRAEKTTPQCCQGNPPDKSKENPSVTLGGAQDSHESLVLREPDVRRKSHLEKLPTESARKEAPKNLRNGREKNRNPLQRSWKLKGGVQRKETVNSGDEMIFCGFCPGKKAKHLLQEETSSLRFVGRNSSSGKKTRLIPHRGVKLTKRRNNLLELFLNMKRKNPEQTKEFLSFVR